MKQDRLNKMNSKIAQIIGMKLNELILEIQSDFGLITINSVKLSPDFSYIDVFVSSIKGKEKLCKTLAKYAFDLKEDLNKKITLRKIPIIRFRYDETIEKTTILLEKIKLLNIK